MTIRERRQTPRKTLEKTTYINIDPNNVGMVLNVSPGGLCFHSVDPVKRNGTIRFGFSGQQQRIEGEGVVTWTDETQRAGLRFTALSQPARDKIHDWLNQGATSPLPAAPAAQSTRDAKPEADVTTPIVMPPPAHRPRLQLSGFSRGLATGLVISALVIAVFTFQGYRRQFGEWLIRTGERFASKTPAQSMAVETSRQAVSPPAQSAAASTYAVPDPVRPQVPSSKVTTSPRKADPTSKTASAAHTSPPLLQAEKFQPQADPVVPQSPPSSAKSQPAKLEPAHPPVSAVITPVSDPAPKADLPVNTMNAALQPPNNSSSMPPVPVASNLVAAKVDTPPKPEAASQPAVNTQDSKATDTPSTSEVFFEVGKFKNPLLAHNEADKVARLGFPAAAVQKGFLWTNSYHVLVGPYTNEYLAKTTHDNLLSDGFKPRTFERGSRSLTLASTVTTDGGSAPEGEYVISWESYIGNASVKFLRNSSLVATANAKWVNRDARYPRDTYVYRKNPDGSRTLLEIHFAGMRKALVFGRSS